MPEPKPLAPGSPFQLKTLIQSGWIYPLVACFILLLLLSAKQIGSYDLGTHLRTGQWIIQNHSFPGKDTFTYTQTSREYLDSNSLYQILLYLLQEGFGYPSLVLLNMLAIVLVFVLLLWRLKLSHAPPVLTCLCLLLAILMMERRFLIRPEVFSWLFLSLTLLVLELRARNKDFLYLLPLIQFLWVNMEGLFILGWFVMASYAFSGRFHQKRWDPKLIRYALLSLVADFLNPYFLKGVLFPFFLLTRLQSSNAHKQTITELHSPLEYLKTQNLHYDSNSHIFLLFVLAGLALLFVFLTLGRRKCHECLLLAAFGMMAFAAVRNIPLFALVAAPILASAVQDYRAQRPWDWNRGKALPLLSAVFILLASLRVATNAFYITDRRVDRLGLGLDAERLPVKAAGFLAQNHLDGRLLNHLDFGGWLDWKGPQPTFIDGRSEVVEDGFYNEYIRSFQGTGLMTLLIRYRPQLILMEYNAAPGWVEQLQHFPDWRLIYLDECAAIYASSDYAKDFPALSFPSLLPARQIPPQTDESITQLLQQVKPSRVQTWLEGFFRPRDYPMGLCSMGLFALKTGEYPSARDLFAAGLRRAGGGYDEVFFNLGVSNLHLKNYSLGRTCFEDALQLYPDNQSARQMMADLNHR